MWHEARKQEKIVRKVIVDYRRRAERRHDYYDKIKQDPTKFMQIHGKQLKLIIDESDTTSNDRTHMVAWQGDKTNMIDRFDVRAHLDLIKEYKCSPQTLPTGSKEEKKSNYERYRILVYNKHKNVSESQHLHKIHINETYPELNLQKQEVEAKKQLLSSSKAMIGFDYGSDNGDGVGSVEDPVIEQEEDGHSSSSDEDFLSELEDIPSLRDLSPEALQDLEKASLEFGMGYTDFVKSMDQDQDIQEKMDKARAVESEKQKMAGKKSRRERRVLRDKRLKNRVIGPLSYMQRDDSNETENESDSSSSDSDSHGNGTDSGKDGEIEFITSFGDNNNSEQQCQPKELSPHSVKATKSEMKKLHKKSRSTSRGRRSKSRSRGSGSRSRRSGSRQRSRSRSRRSRSWSRSHSRRSRSRDRHRRSRSRSTGRRYGRDRRSSWSRKRSPSYDKSRRSRSQERRRSRDNRRSRSRSRRSRSHDRKRSRDKSPAHVITSKKLKSQKVSSLSSSAGGKKLTPQEKLKIKMQRALKKQLKADHIAQADKRAQAYNEQVEREEDLREMARKMRRNEEGRLSRDSPRSYYR